LTLYDAIGLKILSVSCGVRLVGVGIWYLPKLFCHKYSAIPMDTEHVVLNLKLRPLSELDAILLDFLRENQSATASKLVLEALRAYWLPVAVKGSTPPERTRAIAHNCLRTLEIQANYISTVCELAAAGVGERTESVSERVQP